MAGGLKIKRRYPLHYGYLRFFMSGGREPLSGFPTRVQKMLRYSCWDSSLRTWIPARLLPFSSRAGE